MATYRLIYEKRIEGEWLKVIQDFNLLADGLQALRGVLDEMVLSPATNVRIPMLDELED